MFLPPAGFRDCSSAHRYHQKVIRSQNAQNACSFRTEFHYFLSQNFNNSENIWNVAPKCSHLVPENHRTWEFCKINTFCQQDDTFCEKIFFIFFQFITEFHDSAKWTDSVVFCNKTFSILLKNFMILQNSYVLLDSVKKYFSFCHKISWFYKIHEFCEKLFILVTEPKVNLCQNFIILRYT